MTQTERAKNPVYRGLRKHTSEEGGWAIWAPIDWHKTPMTGDHQGIILSPDPADINTCMAVEKHILPFNVVAGDVPELRKGFNEGLQALPGVEIEWQDEAITATLISFDARFTFLENGVRRKRWLRNVYWGEAQVVIIAQGKTVEDYAYWEPVFFNSLMTVEIGVI